MSLFERDGTEAPDLPERYALAIALLSDLHEMVELHSERDEQIIAILADVKSSLVRAALLLRISAKG